MSLSSATSEARGPAGSGSQAFDGVLRGVLQAGVERRPDRQAALEGTARALLPAAELVDDLLLDPRREVRVRRVLGRRLDVALVGSDSSTPSSYC